MANFDELGLDPRLLRALAKLGFAAPTPVQAAAVPKALEGKDVVCRARTGSGKTLAYLLPALHRVLAGGGGGKGGWRALVLVPTRELCEQVAGEVRSVAQHCGAPVTVTALIADAPSMARAAATGAGTFVVSTPTRVATALREGWLPQGALQQRLQVLVLDEADLLLSYGYEDDLRLLAPQVPRSCQCMLMSATTSADVEQLQKLVLHNPTTLNLLAASQPGTGEAGGGGEGAGGGGDGGLAGGGSGAAAEISHYHYPCAKEDRPLVVLALLKLGLLRKKVLIFANTPSEGMRLRLFLESFGIRLALLSPDQPVNSRSHILASFNKGLFDYLIAIDDVHARTSDGAAAAAGDGGSKKARKGKDGKAAAAQQQRQKGGRPLKDEEFGVTRGIDFKGVRTIVNYDLPASVQGYVHRVGRTGRAGQAGAAVTLLTPADLPPALAGPAADAGLVKRAVVAQAQARAGNGGGGAGGAAEGGFGGQLLEARAEEHKRKQEAAAAAANGAGAGGGDSSEEEEDGRGGGGGGAGAAQGPLPLFGRLTKAAVEGLRYRGEDVLRGLTKAAVKEARAREVAQQLLNSDKLKSYFETHEAEQALLRHDKPIHRKQLQQMGHLKHVPAYLKDPATAAAGGRSAVGEASGWAPAGGARQGQQQHGAGKKRPRKEDPLKAIGFAPVGKKRGGGGGRTEELTELEKQALAKPLKDPREKERKLRERALASGVAAAGNVRKGAKAAKQAKRRR